MDSPVGRLLLACDGAGLRQIGFLDGPHPRTPEQGWREDLAPLAEVVRQLEGYFAGRRRRFALRLAPAGSPFQLRVWRQLQEIPYGETISYGELARRVGDPRASRAVGHAVGGNPLPIVIPCHRVVGSGGALVGYGGGLAAKEALLALEQRQLSLLP
jgi:methylated-DNA-[protein]-cysteine S-methyltransferase